MFRRSVVRCRGARTRRTCEIGPRRPPASEWVTGLLHLPHYLPICKGPVLAAISADEFRPRRNYFSSSARSIFSRAEFSQRSFFYRVRRQLPPIYKRPVLSPFSNIRAKKRTLRRVRRRWRAGRAEPANTRNDGSGDAGDGQLTTGTPGPRGVRRRRLGDLQRRTFAVCKRCCFYK